MIPTVSLTATNTIVILAGTITWSWLMIMLGRIGVDDRSFDEGLSEGRRLEREGK